MKAHRITLDDDDADALFLLRRMLEKLYPDSSIAMFSNPEDAPDILITNHGMGKMTGTEMIRTLRAQKVEILIEMVSGNPEVRKEAEKAGANAFIEKTLDMKAIAACIRALLRAFMGSLPQLNLSYAQAVSIQPYAK